MSIVEGYRYESMVDDPDDHRPNSSWALVVDPGDAAGRVDGMAVVAERIAAGDRIPLHRHRVDEVILVRGSGTFHLAGADRTVDDGAVAFIPAGAVHGLRADRGEMMPIHAVFPTTQVWMELLERNPAPDTDPAAPPAPGVTYDFRTGAFVLDGDGST